MSNLTKIEFASLDITGKNYMSWILDVEMHLESMGLLDTIKESNNTSSQDKAKAIIFLRRHLDEGLKYEYLTIKDPSVLWKDLKDRYDHQKEVILPVVTDEWRSLRFQDFKKVNDYNSAMFRICSQLKFCGQSVTDADMLEKTYSTFHASNITLQQQYRLQKFTKYSELISCLLVAEKNNELLMKNHQSRPTGSVAFPEANATISAFPEANATISNNNGQRNNRHGRGRGRGYHSGRSHPHGHNHNFGRSYSYGRGRGRGRGHKTNNYHALRDNMVQPQKRLKMTNHDAEASNSQNPEDSCYRCGSKGHWSRVCRTPSHLCRLYKESLKGKEKEVNFIDHLELNASDFCNDMDL